MSLLSKTLLLGTLLVFSGLAQQTLAQGTADKSKGKYQLVLHVSENNPQHWQLALNNAMAFQRNVGKSAQPS